MSSRGRIAVFLTCLAAMITLAALPETRYAILGLWRGEHFYSFRPTSYWRWKISAFYEGESPPIWTRWYAWLEQRVPFLPHYDPSARDPLAGFDACAVPMLGELTGDQDPLMSARAAFRLIEHLGHWADAADTLSRTLKTAPVEVRRSTVDWMADRDAPIASLLVLKQLLSDTDSQTRVHAAVSVIEKRPDDARAINSLCQALLHDGKVNGDALFDLDWPRDRITALPQSCGCGHFGPGYTGPIDHRCRLALEAANKAHDGNVRQQSKMLLELLNEYCCWYC
jgi:hypothetical protein